ncbi:hypothetical protein FOL47_008472 [Perkinsus chesapeaki]|uniref:Uncharacterized protein n=1 Tax=Perkinsus chesapeaki TaxID=330153 RepID=A0A7J6LDP2_PERCH|nr:hypothetical protein FOL47_008472 [Perkinsus chesapeaki]
MNVASALVRQGGAFQPNCTALRGATFPVYDREAMLAFVPHHALVHREGDELRVLTPGKLSILFMLKQRSTSGMLLNTYDRDTKYLFHLSAGQIGDIVDLKRPRLILKGDYNQQEARVHFRLHERYYREITLERSGSKELITVMMPEPQFHMVRVMLESALPTFYGWDLLLQDVAVKPDVFLERLETADDASEEHPIEPAEDSTYQSHLRQQHES